MLATLAEGNLKAPFSIATTSRCRGRCYSFPFGMIQPGNEPWSPRPLVNTLLISPINIQISERTGFEI